MPPASEIEALLAEEQWIRRLARGLVRDANTADDLVQEAYATALSGDAARPRSARGWLAGVVRNLRRDHARSGARRERRERAAAKREATATTDELVAEVELRKRVAEAVLALDEPLRRAIVLRFFKDQSLPAIARSETIAVSTVHERVERGLAQLRTRLDRSHGGRRDAWSTGLLAFVHPEGCFPATEAAVLGTGAKVAAAVLVLGGALTWWIVEYREERAANTESVLARVPESGAPLELGSPAPVAPASARQALDPAPAESAAHTFVTLEPSVHGLVIDQTGQPVPFLEVAFESNHALRATSAANGGFALVPSSNDEAGPIVSLDERWATLVPHGTRGALRVVVVGPSVRFAGVVLDAERNPLVGARLTVRLRDRLLRQLALQRPYDEERSVESDLDGGFVLPPFAGGEGLFVTVDARGFEGQEVDLSADGDADMEIVLQRDGKVTHVRGTVLLPDGRPASGARVSAGDEIVVADDAGRFDLLWRGTTGRTVKDERGFWRQEGLNDAFLVAALPRRLATRAKLWEQDLASPVVLRLGGETLSIHGRIVDVAGQPCEGLLVWPIDPWPFGRGAEYWSGDEEDSSRMNESTIEMELSGGTSPSDITWEDGSFTLRCLMDRDYEIAAIDPRTYARGGPWTVRAGSGDATLVFTADASVRRVAGRLVDLEGTPLPGAEIIPLRRRLAPPNRHLSQYTDPPGQKLPTAETDTDGRFAFEALATEGTVLEIAHPSLMFRYVELGDLGNLDDIQLVEAVQCEMQLDWSAGPEPVDHLRVFDASGTELEIMEARGSIASWGKNGADVRDGLSNVLRVPQSAASITLLRDGAVVVTLPIRVDPRERTTVRP